MLFYAALQYLVRKWLENIRKNTNFGNFERWERLMGEALETIPATDALKYNKKGLASANP